MIYIIIGLAYGDEGKGVAVQHQIQESHEKGKKAIVYRFGGGHQIGHTSALSYKRDRIFYHTTSNFGSGVLEGVPVVMGEKTFNYPVSAVNERKTLFTNMNAAALPLAIYDKIGKPHIYVHENAMITTPFDLAYNRIDPTARHSSVGVGINATLQRDKEIPLRAFDLKFPSIFEQKLIMVKRYYQERYPELKLEIFDEAARVLGLKDFMQVIPSFVNTAIEKYLEFTTIVNHDEIETLFEVDDLIMEGHQGIMLDEDFGYNPFTTPAHTTSYNAIFDAFNYKISHHVIDITYVMRAYATRHGNGPLLYENDRLPISNSFLESNQANPSQGYFRRGYHNYEELLYALYMDRKDSFLTNHVNRNLLITCLDQTKGDVLYHRINQGKMTPQNLFDLLNKDGAGLSSLSLNFSPLPTTIKRVLP